MLVWLIGLIAGISGDVLLCWLSWRFIIKPKLTKFVDKRIESYQRKQLAELNWSPTIRTFIPIDGNLVK